MVLMRCREGEAPAEPHRQRDWGDFTGVMSAFFARGLPSGGSLRSIRCHPPFRDVIAHDEGHKQCAHAGRAQPGGRSWDGETTTREEYFFLNTEDTEDTEF